MVLLKVFENDVSIHIRTHSIFSFSNGPFRNALLREFLLNIQKTCRTDQCCQILNNALIKARGQLSKTFYHTLIFNNIIEYTCIASSPPKR